MKDFYFDLTWILQIAGLVGAIVLAVGLARILLGLLRRLLGLECVHGRPSRRDETVRP